VAAKRAGFSSETIARYVRRWMEQEPLPMLPRFVCRGLIDFLRRCRASGIRLAVLSDYPAVGKLQSLGIADFFDVVLSAQSREIGAFKPNPKGLMTAMQRFGVAGHECLYIGDRVDVDAAAAQAAGVPCAILTTRPAAFSDGFLTVEDYPQLQNLLFGLGHASVGESFQPS
jgi:HAD superfamily hydrolase (TIGR01549 family)